MFDDELLDGITDSLVGLDERVGELERKENPAEGGIGPFIYEVHVAIAGGGDFTSVKAAADYVLLTAQADEFWTIVVHVGDYTEAAFEIPANTSIVGVGNAFISATGISGTYITLADNCTLKNLTITLNMDPTSVDCWAVTCAGYVVLEDCTILVNRSGGSGSSQAIGVVKTETGDINNCWLRLVTQEVSYPGDRTIVRFDDASSAQRSYLRDCTIGYATTNQAASLDISIAIQVATHYLFVIDCTIQKRASGETGFDIQATSGGTAFTSGTLYVKSSGTVTNLDSAVGAGGVTSVGLANTANGILTFANSPITTSGTIDISFANQFAFTVLARQGSDGPPGFQSLQAGHIPNLPASKITSGTLGAGIGGTGNTSYAVGDLLYASGATTLSKLAGVATGNALISGGVATAPSWGKIGLTTHVSGTLGPSNGGSGAANTGNLTWGAATSITGGGAFALGGFTLTVPATGTAALLGAANVFTAVQKIDLSAPSDYPFFFQADQPTGDGTAYAFEVNSDGSAPRQSTFRSRGTKASKTAVTTGSPRLFTLDIEGYDGTGYVASSGILFEVGGTVGTGAIPGLIRFRVATAAGTVTDAARITSDLAFLIGKTSGLSGAGDLDVQGNTRLTGNVGFYNTTPVAKPTVTGSRGGNAALGNLLTALDSQGLITNSTTA